MYREGTARRSGAVTMNLRDSDLRSASDPQRDRPRLADRLADYDAGNAPTLEDEPCEDRVCDVCGNWLRVHWRGRRCYQPEQGEREAAVAEDAGCVRAVRRETQDAHARDGVS